MKTKIVSAIYFDLYGTDLGGRPGRNDHYLYSMNSIMNIDNAEFIIYTNDKTKVDVFFADNYADKLIKFTSIQYDLYNTEYRESINKIKDYLSTRQSFRCIELQYSKLSWLKMNAFDCDYIYWIDAGLCYSGLLPDKYLKTKSGRYNDSYYGSDIFTSSWLSAINECVNEKILVCAKENVKNYWEGPLPSDYFITQSNADYHIVGGLFGGRTNSVNIMCDKFYNLTSNLLANEKFLYSEEQILSCLFVDNQYLFHPEFFDIWWHENNVAGNVGQEAGRELLSKNKSFYKIIEKFI